MPFKRFLFLFLPVLALQASVIPGGPSDHFISSYSVTLQAGFPNVTNILMLEEGPASGGTTWAFQADGDPDVPVTSVLVNPFPHPKIPTTALLIGIATGFATDADPDQKHVVLMMDPTSAALAEHIAFGTLFRSTTEEDLLAAIELATSGLDFDTIGPGLDFLGTFAHGDAQTGILGPGGVPHSAWFTPGSAFSVVAFSDAQVIGAGESDVTVAAPEPGTLAYLCFGAIALPLLRRKLRRG